ncbi:PLP-dependent aminotransferase family protein [Brevibacterium sp. BRM-1]|uniref:aminotransferase-like domain-containing protein n=1 Tax=Brevibacterium sp. BRM-1 TaxID=2999062 RepID=UPI00228059A6|nr:PLP-dependent aminotransferase family protein [Brevibacterium sp. BRM-1]WAL40562.1 PLP-dependent aminotransferase family protein [Brevibacterium sp. BRM-1]
MTSADEPTRYARAFEPKPLSRIFEIALEGGYISFASGDPNPAFTDTGWMAEEAARLLRQPGDPMLQYGSGAGQPSTREAIVELMADQRADLAADAVQVFSGAQNALDVITRLLVSPGDAVFVDEDTYPAMLNLLRAAGAHVIPVATDAEGLVPEALDAALARAGREGRAPRMLYTIPDFNNPRGTTLAEDRRPRVVEACRAAGALIVEDAAYSQLAFDGRRRPSLWSYDPQAVFHLGSFSKILAPGLRVGWAVCPDAYRALVQNAANSSVISPNVLAQELAARFVERGGWREAIRESARRYSRQFEAFAAALRTHDDVGLHYVRPEGGFFCWLDLPGGADAQRVLDRALERKLVFLPGTMFRIDGATSSSVRAAFSFETEEHLDEGVARLVGAVRAELAGEDSAGRG